MRNYLKNLGVIAEVILVIAAFLAFILIEVFFLETLWDAAGGVVAVIVYLIVNALLLAGLATWMENRSD